MVIYFDNGELIYAASNLRPHRLLESLRRWRVITEEQYKALSTEPKTDAEAARALVEKRVLTEDALREVRAQQVMDVLRPALLWTEGAWSFDPRVRLSEEARIELELSGLFMEAARRLPRDWVAARYSNTNEKLHPRADGSNNANLQPIEAFVLSRIDSSMRLHELLSISGLPREETLHACYALELGGLIERERSRRAFTPEEVAKAQALSAAAARSAATQERAPEARKVEEAKKAEPVVDEKSELEELFARVGRATNHYEVLGVARSADQDTLKQTYHRLARRFHPDRFHQDAALYSRVQDVFAKVTQAYDTLRDRAARASYDLKLEKEGSAPQPSFGNQAATKTVPPASKPAPASTPSRPANGEESYQRGMAAMKIGNKPLALSAFAEAARLGPQVAKYRAQYGQALAENVQMRHRAETEIQAAITLEPSNIAYRIALARLYQNLGFLKRAQGEIERALALDAQNTEALKLLEELQLRQGAR